jgi:hypothetical protein
MENFSSSAPTTQAWEKCQTKKFSIGHFSQANNSNGKSIFLHLRQKQIETNLAKQKFCVLFMNKYRFFFFLEDG